MSMPSTYDTGGATTGTASEPYDRGYLFSLDSVLKITQAVLGLITFICATVFDPFVTYWGGGWVQFVGITAFLLCVLLWFMYFFYIMDKIPATVPMTLIEFIYYAVFTLFFFTAGIVAAVKGNRDSAIGAAAFFSFASFVAFGVDVYFKFMKWRSGYPRASTGGGVTTTTSTTTASATVEAGAQY